MNIIENKIEKRQIGIDLYRIFCCFLITTIHLFGYSKFLDNESLSVTNRFFVSLISSINIVGVNGFIFISSYFLCENGKKGNFKRIISFVLQLNFISILIFVVIAIINREFTLIQLIKSFFPLLTQHWWYPFNYVMFLFLSPFLNILINGLSKRELKILIFFIVFTVCVFLKFNFFYDSNIFMGHDSHGFVWWITLYLSAAYYRHYGVSNNKAYGVVFFVCMILTIFLNFFRNYFPSIINLRLLEDSSIIGYLATVSSFIMFNQITNRGGMKLIQVMKVLIPSTFIVYIFQEHIMIREMLWKKVNINQYAQESIMNIIFITFAVFFVIMLISVIIHITFSFAKKIYITKIETKILYMWNNFRPFEWRIRNKERMELK